MKNDIIVICGPTGVGKTSVTIKLAKEFGGQIINADSMQIYRYMDIGTAKPTPAEVAEVKHYLVDFVEPDEPFDAARFAEKADEKIRDFVKEGITPFIAGGTGLYIKSLIDGLFRAKPVSPDVLKGLNIEAEEKGLTALHKQLSLYDPESAKKIHPNDAFRIIRALEVFLTTGKTISEYHASHKFAERRYRALKIGLLMDREALYERINRRVDLMIGDGFLQEVETLVEKGYSPLLKSMRSLGYRHMLEYIKGEKNWEEALRTLKRDTRRYAKRQLTWFRGDDEIVWIAHDNIDEMNRQIKSFLGKKD